MKFLPKICNFALLNHFFVDFLHAQLKKFSLNKGGVNKKFSWDKGGVNKVSGRRGDLDYTLQEGGNGTLPPHAHVWQEDAFHLLHLSLDRE